MTLTRTQPLVRTRGLKRSGPPARRTKLAVKSRKTIKEDRHKGAVWLQVYERDGGCRARTFDQLGPCFGPLTPHHVLKASQGGKFTTENIICLCSAHNTAVEDWPDLAYGLGLVRKSWESR